MSGKILIIEDEPALQELLRFHLVEEGYEVKVTGWGDEGFRLALSSPPDLIVLDLMLPDGDGMEICRRLKRDEKTKKVPVLILTAKGTASDKILGFEVGADDYVTKPFSPRELVLRIRAVLKRITLGSEEGVYSFGALKVDPARPRVTYKGKNISLTPIELRLLHYLYQTRGRVQSREILLDKVWGYNSEVTTRTVDAHVKRLREKLRCGEELIETVRGLGYRFQESPTI